MRRTDLPAIMGMNTDLDPIKIKDKYAQKIVNFRLDSSGNAILIDGYNTKFGPEGMDANTQIWHIERFEEYLSGEVSWYAFTNTGVYKRDISLTLWGKEFSNDIRTFDKELSVMQYQNKIFVADKLNAPLYILPRGAQYISGGGAGIGAEYEIYEDPIKQLNGQWTLRFWNSNHDTIIAEEDFGLPPLGVGEHYELKNFFPNSNGDIMWVICVVSLSVCKKSTIYLYINKSGRIMSQSFYNDTPVSDPDFDSKTFLLYSYGLSYGATKFRDNIVLFNNNIMIIKNRRTYMVVYSFMYDDTTQSMEIKKVDGSTVSHPDWNPLIEMKFNVYEDYQGAIVLTNNNTLFYQFYSHNNPSRYTYIKSSNNSVHKSGEDSFNMYQSGSSILHLGINTYPVFDSDPKVQYPFTGTNALNKSHVANDNIYTISDKLYSSISDFIGQDYCEGFTVLRGGNGDNPATLNRYVKLLKNGTPIKTLFDMSAYLTYQKDTGDGWCKENSFFSDSEAFINVLFDDNHGLRNDYNSLLNNIYCDKNNTYIVKLACYGTFWTLRRKYDSDGATYASHMRDLVVKAIVTKGEDSSEIIYEADIISMLSLDASIRDWTQGAHGVTIDPNRWENHQNNVDGEKFWYLYRFYNYIIENRGSFQVAINTFVNSVVRGNLFNNHINTDYYKGDNDYKGYNSPSKFTEYNKTLYNTTAFNQDMLWYIDAPPLFDATIISESSDMNFDNLDIHVSYITGIGESIKTKLQHDFEVRNRSFEINFFKIFKDLKYSIDGIKVYFYSEGRLIGTDFIPIGSDPTNPDDHTIQDFNLNPIKPYNFIPPVATMYSGKSFIRNPYIMTKHLERVILAGDKKYPDYEYYSLVFFPEVFQGSAGNNDSGVGTKPIEYNDGDNITAHVSMYDRLYIFKNNRTYVVVGDIGSTDQTFMTLDKNKGCISKRSLTVNGNTLMFLGNQGICALEGNDVRVMSENKINRFIFDNQEITDEDRNLAQGVNFSKRNQYRLYIGRFVIVYDVKKGEFWVEDKLPDGIKYNSANQINTEDGQDYILITDNRGIVFKEEAGKLFFDRKRWGVIDSKKFKLSNISDRTYLYNLGIRLLFPSSFDVGINSVFKNYSSREGEQMLRLTNKPSTDSMISIRYNGTDDFGISMMSIDHE